MKTYRKYCLERLQQEDFESTLYNLNCDRRFNAITSGCLQPHALKNESGWGICIKSRKAAAKQAVPIAHDRRSSLFSDFQFAGLINQCQELNIILLILIS